MSFDWLDLGGKLLAPVVSAGVSIFVARFTARRETRRVTHREALRAALSELDDLHTATLQLFETAGSDPQAKILFQAIRIGDHRIGRALNEVFSELRPQFVSAQTAVPMSIENARIKLRQLVTDDDLVAAERQALAHSDPKLETLKARCESLRLCIRDEAKEFGVNV